jgi:hypothetical protein
VTTPTRASTTTATGTSKAMPKTRNSVSTKPKYCSMSGAAVMLVGAKAWMNCDMPGMTRK